MLDWLASQQEGTVFLSVVTLAEIRDGVDRLPTGKRRNRIEAWLDHALPERFRGHILSIDPSVANRAGALMAASKQAGRNLKWMDLLIAATALTYDMQLATLNRKDFEKLGVSLVDLQGRRR